MMKNGQGKYRKTAHLRAEKRIMMNCEHKNRTIRDMGDGKVNVLLEEQCLDCGHTKWIDICECCGQGQATYIHQTEPEHCVEERKEEWTAVCEACHIAIKGG
jgi:hypothetical protein